MAIFLCLAEGNFLTMTESHENFEEKQNGFWGS